MNIIERAGRQLGLQSSKSLVERAAARLSHPQDGALGHQEPVARPDPAMRHEAPADSVVPPRRETRKHITIDFERLRARGFALPDDQSALAEELRLIKRPLLSAAFGSDKQPGENANLIMVTSANPNEGKTFIAANLAFSMASEHGVHVLLIDADVVRPAMPDLLGFEASRGLVDAVSDSGVDLADVMVRTNIPNLIILPAGTPRPGASELLASARMARFVEDIAKRYSDRVVIFDTPPVLARSEPIVLAQHVGQIVLVVEAERTSPAAVREALDLIGQRRFTGVILNKAPTMPLHEGFGQYYSYSDR